MTKDNSVRLYLAGSPEFKKAQEQFKPLADSELKEQPLFDDYDELVVVETVTEKADWQTSAAMAFMVVATRLPYLTTDDIYAELLKGGIRDPSDARAMGIAVQRAKKANLIVDAGGAPVPSQRTRSHGRPIRKYQSLIFGTNTATLPTRENEKKRSTLHNRESTLATHPEQTASEYWKSKRMGQ